MYYTKLNVRQIRKEFRNDVRKTNSVKAVPVRVNNHFPRKRVPNVAN